jgi:hypothetical protein
MRIVAVQDERARVTFDRNDREVPVLMGDA